MKLNNYIQSSINNVITSDQMKPWSKLGLALLSIYLLLTVFAVLEYYVGIFFYDFDDEHIVAIGAPWSILLENIFYYYVPIEIWNIGGDLVLILSFTLAPLINVFILYFVGREFGNYSALSFRRRKITKWAVISWTVFVLFLLMNYWPCGGGWECLGLAVTQFLLGFVAAGIVIIFAILELVSFLRRK